MQNKMAKDFAWRFRQIRVGMRLIVSPEQQSDAEKREHNWDIGETRQYQGAATAADIHRSQHSLHHVLIGPVCGHGDEGRTDQSGENGVLNLEHSFPPLPALFCWVQAGSDEIGDTEPAMALHNLLPATGNGGVEQTERDEGATDHDGSLDKIGPN